MKKYFQCFYCKKLFLSNEPISTKNGGFVCNSCVQNQICSDIPIGDELHPRFKYESMYGGMDRVYVNIIESNTIKMSGVEFEYFCADILHLDGFTNITITKASGDKGADIKCQKNGISYVVQCKCLSGTCSNKAIQEVLSAKNVYNANKCITMCNSRFSPQAMILANTYGVELYNFGRIKYILECHFASLDAA